MVSFGFEHSYSDELDGTYVSSPPDGFPAPALMTLDRALWAQLGLPTIDDGAIARVVTGTELPDDADPIALAYAGHQFGSFNPQLGDGRAVLLGERVDRGGNRWDIQLKGSGRTVFSRGGDGLAAVGPVVREHLVSHGMHHLRIPTTRVLATARTGQPIRRERLLPGAVLARVARSHLRVGTFQFFAVRQDVDQLRKLVRYAVARHDPDRLSEDNLARVLLEGVADRQADLIAAWLNVGFVHGVMNTDNVTISGETLDYGPCAFLDAYDPMALFSSIDHGGRYAFGNQPEIGAWNLARLGEAVLPLLDEASDRAVAMVHEVLSRFADRFTATRLSGLRAKVGLVDPANDALIEALLALMYEHTQDFTGTFRRLATSLRTGQPAVVHPDFIQWEARWKRALGGRDRVEIADEMDRVNPAYIPRNHLVEEALDAATEGDLGPSEALLAVLSRPFTVQEGKERYAEPAPAEFGAYVTYCGT